MQAGSLDPDEGMFVHLDCRVSSRVHPSHLVVPSPHDVSADNLDVSYSIEFSQNASYTTPSCCIYYWHLYRVTGKLKQLSLIPVHHV